MSEYRDCVITLEQNAMCFTCPEIAPVAQVDAQHFFSPNIGWNAGANSLVQIGGNVHAGFDAVAGDAGAVLGFRPASDIVPPVSPARITHGLYSFSLYGDWVIAMEGGIQKGTPVQVALGDIVELRRLRGRVTYVLNGITFYTSAIASTGLVRVTGCLYAAPDYLN